VTENKLAWDEANYDICEKAFVEKANALANDTKETGKTPGYYDQFLPWLIEQLVAMKARYQASELRQVNAAHANEVDWAFTEELLYPRWVLENLIDQYLVLLSAFPSCPDIDKPVYEALYPKSEGWFQIELEAEGSLEEGVEALMSVVIELKNKALKSLRSNLEADQIDDLMTAYLNRFTALSPTLGPFCHKIAQCVSDLRSVDNDLAVRSELLTINYEEKAKKTIEQPLDEAKEDLDQKKPIHKN